VIEGRLKDSEEVEAQDPTTHLSTKRTGTMSTTTIETNAFNLADAELQTAVGGRKKGGAKNRAQRQARKFWKQHKASQPQVTIGDGGVTVGGVWTGGPTPARFDPFEQIDGADEISFPQMPG
jgi:hypothetical protein